MPIAQSCSSIPHKAGKEIRTNFIEAISDTTTLDITLLSKSVDKTANFR